MTQIDEKERLEYSKKLESQIKGIDALIDLPSSIITPSIIEELKKIRGRAEKCKRKIDTGEFEIAIVGLEKSGKSTFANALIENNTLPVADERCTYTSSSIRYGEKDHAVVKFMEVNEFYNDFTDKLKQIGIPNAKALSLKTLSLTDYKGKFKEIGNKFYENTLNKEIESILEFKDSITYWLGKGEKQYDDLENQELKDFISSKRVSFAAKQIDIQTTKLEQMKNAIIYDVPGFNSPTLFMKEQTKKYMKEADAVLFVARANEPSIDGTVGGLFMEYTKESDSDGVTLAEKLFPFANKTDYINVEPGKTLKDKILENGNTLFAGLSEFCNFNKKERIVFGSAQGRLDEIKQEDTNGICEKLAKAGYTNGIVEIKEKLAAYNRDERFPILKRRIDRIQVQIEELFSDLKDKYNLNDNQILPLKISNEKTLTLRRESVEKIKSELSKYNDEIKQEMEKCPLTSQLVEKLNVWMCNNGGDNSNAKSFSDFDVSKYAVTSDTLEKARLEVDEVSANWDNVPFIETYFRKEKLKNVRKDFEDTVLELATRKHEECENAIKDIFKNGLGINPGNSFYQELETKVSNFLGKIKKTENNGYYKSLVDRFSSAVIEILMVTALGKPRRTYFDNQRSNFYMLACADTANIDTSAPIDKQPLFYLLLHQEDKKSGNKEDDKWQPVLDEIKKFVKNVPLDIIKMFVPFGKLEPVMKIVEKWRDNYATMNTTDEKKLSFLYNALKTVNQQTGVADEDDLYSERYDVQIGSKEEFMEIMNKDLQILNYVLIHYVVKAIALESPFKTLINNFIQQIKSELEAENFDKFISDNISMIKSEEYKSIENAVEENRRNIEAVKIINGILQEMKSTK
ncbi:MAG: dynamin family protein [Bacteroidales bacterium]|nr:dynamin family protein [Bacteroidales bacterium]